MRTIWVLSMLAVGLIGCGGSSNGKDLLLGNPTGVVCPDAGTTLRYDDGSGTADGTFGKTFFADNCLGCHSVAKSGLDRLGAPTDHNFDTQQLIQGMTAHIDEVAGAGNGVVNTLMPPAPRTVDTATRQQLSLWLACGAQ